MDALKSAVATAFDKVVASGAIEQAVETHIAKAVTSAIADQFGYGGDLTKAIKEKVASLIDIDLSRIDLPSYRDLVGKIITERVGAAMTTQFTEQLGRDIDSLLAPAPDSITLEQLLEEFVKSKADAYNADDLRGREFTLIIDRDKNSSLAAGCYIEIFIDEGQDTEKYSCAIHLRLRGEGEVWALKLGGDDIKNKLFVGPLFDFEKRLFQMYTARTKLVLAADASVDDFDTYFPGDD